MADLERELDAAERALGTLPLSGESAEDRALREAWDARLAPLLDDIPPEAPPLGLYARIVGALGDADRVVVLDAYRRSVSRWKAVAAAATAVAAGLAIYIAVGVSPVEKAPKYVAIVTSDLDGSAGLIVEIDTATGEATIIPIGLTPPAGQSYEMWHLPQGAERPISIGLLPEGPVVHPKFVAGAGDLFAISLEPQGVSPTGQPTQPVDHGRAVVVE